ncbi:hypothetical protein [Xanthomonas theicola]|uniref:hypothetical protein n=1 Tax=Xanthomonas theicola TaxID=56464 RepID=UPI0036D9A267
MRDAAGRGWALIWLLLLLGLGVFDSYLPFYPFALHAALAVASLYASGGDGGHRLNDAPRSTTW